MANPLKLADGGGSGGSGPMNPGDIRQVHVKDKDGSIIKTITIHRTTREYCHDLCDAYNDACSQEVIDRGGEWYVTPNKTVALGIAAGFTVHHTKQLARHAETERLTWIEKKYGEVREAAE